MLPRSERSRKQLNTIMPMNFNQKAGKSLIWSALDNMALRGLSFIVILLMTRLLTPEDFGLIGILQIIILLGNSIIDGGFGQSLIRDEHSNDVDFSTVFFLTFIIGICLFGIVFLTADFVASYFGNPMLDDLLKVYALIFIISPFSIIQNTKLMKEMNFKRVFFLNAPGSVLGGIIGISMAYQGYGVWSIIGLHVSSHLFKSIFIWFGSPWKPQLVFSMKKLKYHFNFGSKIIISGVLGTIFRELYIIVIAKSFSVMSLGYYTRAKTYSLLPMSISSDAISKAIYPILSRLKHDSKKISSSYQSIIRATFFILTPLMLTLSATAAPLFKFLFTEKWLPAVPYFRILTLSSILYPIHELNITIFKIYGKTGLFLRLNLIKQSLVILAVIIGLFSSLNGLLWAMVAISYVALLINTYYSDKMISYGTFSQLKDMSKTLVSSITSALLAFLCLNEYLSNQHLLIQIGLTSLISLASYFLISVITRNKGLSDFLLFTKIIQQSLRA